MSVNSLPKTVKRQRRDCDLNSGSSAPEFSALATRLPSHVEHIIKYYDIFGRIAIIIIINRFV